jgi:hypothetical protein
VKLEGSMSLEQRNATIAAFSNDPDIVVFLMSLKAGGVALNLTAASHVMLMDPWWNPVSGGIASLVLQRGLLGSFSVFLMCLTACGVVHSG